MNKSEFIDASADGAELTKADAGRALDAMVAAITKALKKGDTVTPVSYTHLDVYKRQDCIGVSICLAASCRPQALASCGGQPHNRG